MYIVSIWRLYFNKASLYTKINYLKHMRYLSNIKWTLYSIALHCINLRCMPNFCCNFSLFNKPGLFHWRTQNFARTESNVPFPPSANVYIWSSGRQKGTQWRYTKCVWEGEKEPWHFVTNSPPPPPPHSSPLSMCHKMENCLGWSHFIQGFEFLGKKKLSSPLLKKLPQTRKLLFKY